MKLSLSEACRLLGKTPRQVRYLIKTGRLTAHKVSGRWVINTDALPLSEGQRRAQGRKVAALEDAVEDAIAPHKVRARRHYSVRDITAFALGAPILTAIHAALTDAHPATAALREALQR